MWPKRNKEKVEKEILKELHEKNVTVEKFEHTLGLMIDYASANLKFCKEITENVVSQEPKIEGIKDIGKKNIKKILDERIMLNSFKRIFAYINKPTTYYKRYVAMLHLHETLNVLSTLLLPSPGEVSFITYFLLNNNSSEQLRKGIYKIADNFGKKKFKEYRNKSVAHKSFLWIEKDPFSLLISTTKKETLDYIEQIITELRKIAARDFKSNMISNSYFYENTKEGLSTLLN